MPGARRFEDLVCWQEARALSMAIEAWLHRGDMNDRSYIDQLRRAITSVQVNIAEGFDRYRHADFHRFLTVSKGSLAEVRALLVIALDRQRIDAATDADLHSQSDRLAKRLARLMQYLRGRREGRSR